MVVGISAVKPYQVTAKDLVIREANSKAQSNAKKDGYYYASKKL